MDATLKKIITECQRGNMAAQRAFFERYKSKLYNVCLRYARDRPEAEDMLQDAFLAIFRDLGQYKGDGVFDGWLHRITVRSSLRSLRKKNPLRFAEDYNELPVESMHVMPDSELMKESILHLVQQLPTGYRTIFNMHCIETWSYTEIAEELGISESSVRSQYSRACKQLREMVDRLFKHEVKI
jgi:RNA polymerase sigma factor (sigma-70 family)